MSPSPATAAATAIQGGSLIAGAWSVSGGATFRGVDPASGLDLATGFHEACPEQIEGALVAAQAACELTARLDPRWPARLLTAIADGMLAAGGDLVSRACAESGLPEARILGERARTCAQLRLFADEVMDGSWVDAVIDRGDPSRRPQPKPDVRRMRCAIGPVVVFDASNFPLAFGAGGGDTASALAAGNPVVVKGHPAHPGTNAMVAQVIADAVRALAFPAGVFSLLQGRGHDLGRRLVEHPRTQAVAFTGSHRVGRLLCDIAAARPQPIPVFAEMGSLNPVILLPDALAHGGAAIAEGLAASITLGAGQFCTKPGVVFVVADPSSDACIDALARRLGEASPMTMLGRPQHVAFAAAVARLAEVEPLCRGRASGHAATTPWLFSCTAERWLSDDRLRDEAFGPAALVVRCADHASLLAAISVLPGQLTATIHAGDGEDAELLRRCMRTCERIAGRVVFGGYPTGVEVCRAMVHGGPYPASSAAWSTSVGASAIARFTRPISWQGCPQPQLPPALRDANPLGIARVVDGVRSAAAI